MEPEPEHGAPSISLMSYARLVRGNRNFRRLWLAQIVSEIGDWFYTLSIYTLLLQLTGHASSVALALVLQVLPQTLVGPTAGVVNDRLRRKRVMIAADLGPLRGRLDDAAGPITINGLARLPAVAGRNNYGSVLRTGPQLGNS